MTTRNASSAQPARSSFGLAPAWVMLLAGVVAALHVGKVAPAVPILQQALGLSLVEAGFLISLVQIASVFIGLAVGLAVSGWGYKRSVVAGLAILATSSIAGGWSQGAAALLTFRALEGLGFLLVVMPAPSLIRRLVTPKRMSTMLGFWSTYIPFGSAVALLVGPLVITTTGWQSWWWGLGLIAAAMCVWVMVAIPTDPRHVVAPASAGGHTTGHGTWQHRLALTLSAPGPWAVALSFAVYAGQWLAVVGFLPSIYAAAGVSGGLAGLLTALAAGINMVGCIGSGRLLTHGVAPHRLLYTGFTVMSTCVVVAFVSVGGVSAPPVVQYLAILLFSAVGGYIPGTLFTLAVKLAPNESTVSTTVGWMQQWSSSGQLLVPPLVGWVAGITGGWSWTWVICLACGLTGLALARFIATLVNTSR